MIICGASGVGKSIFLRAIVDLDENEGEVSLGEISRNNIAAHKWRKIVAYVPAQSGWWADIVGEHFTINNDLYNLLAELGFAQDVLDWQVARLSSGEMQRLGLARALCNKPKALLLDEPTSALDKKTTKIVEELIKKQLKNNLPIIMISHDEEQIKRLANRAYLLEGGKLKEQSIIGDKNG